MHRTPGLSTHLSPASARPPDFGGRYQGRVAVVTGASAGLGAQLSMDLARGGATVVGLARNAERLDKLATDLCTFTSGSGTITCDVADTDALRRALDEVTAAHGPVDLLVNNAAQDPGVRLVEIAERDFRHTFDVNFFAPVAATLAVLPSMLQRGRGTIVNVSSDGGRLPSPGPGAYPSSKAALSAFTESTSFRLGPKGVHVHVVYPAFMATELGIGRPRARPAPAPAPDHPERRDRVTADPGPGRGPVARNQRVGPHRCRHGLPFRHAPDLSPPAAPLVGRAVRSRKGRLAWACGHRSGGRASWPPVGTAVAPARAGLGRRKYRCATGSAKVGPQAGGTTCTSRSTTTSF